MSKRTDNSYMSTKTSFNPSRLIDFVELRKKARKTSQHSSLSTAELLTTAVEALDAWEQCGGRKFGTFHDLLDVIEETIS